MTRSAILLEGDPTMWKELFTLGFIGLLSALLGFPPQGGNTETPGDEGGNVTEHQEKGPGWDPDGLSQEKGPGSDPDGLSQDKGPDLDPRRTS
jgi:hypothetical protein